MWDKIWEGIRAAILTFFGPPDVDDEAALLDWLDKTLSLLDWIAARTSTDIDDKAVAGLREVVQTPAKWAVVYPLVVKMFGDGVIGTVDAATVEARGDVAKAAAAVGMPIGLFVQILLMLLKLLRR